MRWVRVNGRLWRRLHYCLLRPANIAVGIAVECYKLYSVLNYD